MRFAFRSSILAAAALFFAASAVAQQTQPVAPGDKVQVIELTAKKYEFSPSPIQVKNGAKVQLKIRALDKTHGFKVGVYPEGSNGAGAPGLVFTNPQESWKIETDKETVIEFTAQQPGTYDFKCAVFCGFGHGGMKGQIIVEP